MTDWQPIETAPKDGTHIISFTPGIPYAQVGVRYWGRSGAYNPLAWLSVPNSINHIDQPTHWMPVPEPPQ